MLTKLKSLRRRLVKSTGRFALNALNGLYLNQSRVGREAVLNPNQFPWLLELEQNWQVVRDEALQLLARRDSLPAFHEVSPDQIRISHQDHWKVFPLFVFGQKYDPGCAICPATAALLDRVPILENAMFSILSPRYHIPAHSGPTSGLMRVHLPLIVPADTENCWIRVADQYFNWQEGRCVVFDDHFEHEVWNGTDELRVVLFFDFDRPMKALGSAVNRFALAALRRTAYVRDMHANLKSLQPRYLDGGQPAEPPPDPAVTSRSR